MTNVAVTGLPASLVSAVASGLRAAGIAEVAEHAIDRLLEEGDPGRAGLDGVDVVVHVPWRTGISGDGSEQSAWTSVDEAKRLFDRCRQSNVTHLVLVSTALVYGAWSENPVPLPEDAPVRPNPGATFAEAMVEIERLAEGWSDEGDGRLSVLRTVPWVGGATEPWTTSVLGGLRAARLKGASRPVQFVHVDDLVAAVVAIVEKSPGGIFNVAPEGWVPAEVARSLASGPLHVGLPRRLARFALDLPEPYLAYLEEPWVVSSVRLRQLGWSPEHSNEEALVAGRPPSLLMRISPRHRQELALAGASAGLLGLGLSIWALIKRVSAGR